MAGLLSSEGQGVKIMFSINESVTPYIEELLGREEELGVRSYYLENHRR